MHTTPVALTVALPAYEEGPNLAVLLPELKRVLETLGVTWEIVVVDTETPHDDTPAVCAASGATYLPRRGGPEYGHAVRTALAASRGRHVVMMDADGSHAPEFITKLWAEREAANLVIASRYVAGGGTDNPAVLILLSQIVNVVFRLVLGLRCADVSNSLRLYTGADVRALKLTCHNFDVVEEILVDLTFSRPGYTVKEIPFTFGRRKEGKTKRNLWTFAWSYLATIQRLYLLKRRALTPLASTQPLCDEAGRDRGR
ncbi:MAG: glycosyltransferase [Anaeromyxobacteraceae bacterium]